MDTYVYCFRSKSNPDVLKIGVSIDPKRRARDLNVPFDIYVSHVYLCSSTEEAFKTEKIVLKAFRDYKVKGEWFQADPEILNLIDEVFVDVSKRELPTNPVKNNPPTPLPQKDDNYTRRELSQKDLDDLSLLVESIGFNS